MNLYNDKKYHYYYKITHKPSGRYYLGIHSTDDLNDNYMGSGNVIKSMIKKYGRHEFSKEIIKFFQNREDLLNYEASQVTEQRLKQDKLILNLSPGGINKNLKIGKNRRLIPVKDKFGNRYSVYKDDPRYLSGELVHVNVGNSGLKYYKTVFKDGIYETIHESYLSDYLEDGWILQSHSKGRISPTKGLIHIFRDDYEKMIAPEELDDYLKAGWMRGRITSPCKNKIMITKDGVDKYCREFELQEFLKDGWRRGGHSRNKGRVMLYNKNTGESISVLKTDPIINNPEWVYQINKNGSPAKNTKYINKDGVVMRVPPEQIQQYLDRGWNLGMKPKKSHRS